MINCRDIVVALLTAGATLSLVAARAQTNVMQSTAFDWNAIANKQTDVGAVRQFFRSPTATLDELESDALVERSPDPDDGRRKIVTITPAGKRRLAKLDDVVTGVQEELLARLSKDERAELVRLLTAVV